MKIYKYINNFNVISRVKLYYACSFAEDLNNNFQEYLITLIICSIPNICLTMYSVSTHKGSIDVQYLATCFSSTAVLIQLYLFCWFGNEVSLHVCIDYIFICV